MKTIKFILCIFCSFVIFSQLSYSKANQFKYENMIHSLIGFVTTQKSIVIYESEGIILLSTDKGENWQQKKIADDSVWIYKIINIRDTLYGVATQCLIKSTDNGNTWQLKQLDYYPGDINTDGNNLYLVDLEFINSQSGNVKYTNTLKTYNLDFMEIKSTPINVDSSIAIEKFRVFNNKIIFTTKYTIVSLDLSNNLKDSINNLESITFKPEEIIYDLKIENNVFYLITSGWNDNFSDLYSSTDSGKSWKLLMNDYLTSDQIKYYKGKVYYISTASHTVDHGWISFNILDSLGNISKININDKANIRYTSIYKLDFNFLDDSTLIATSNNQTILKSKNAGKNWMMKSDFDILDTISQMYWINDKIGFVTGKYGRIFRTKDGGITWLPQLYTDTLLYKSLFSVNSIESMRFDSTGLGIVMIIPGSTFSGDNSKALNLNILITKDFGETYTSYWRPEYCNSNNNNDYKHGVYLYINKGNFIIISSPLSLGLIVEKTDNNLNTLSKQTESKIFSIYNVLYYYKNLWGTDQLFFHSLLNVSSGTTNVNSIISSPVSGISLSVDFNCSISGTECLVSHADTNHFIAYTNGQNNTSNLYYIDLHKKSTKLIFNETGYPSKGFPYLEFNNTLYYINNNNELYSSDNYFTDNPTFSKVKNDIRNAPNGTILDSYKVPYSKQYYWMNDSIIYISATDINGFSVLTKLTFLSETTEVNDIPKNVLDKDSYISETYPSPANDHVSAYAFWNGNCDINKADFSVFDIYGNNLTDKTKLIFTQENSNKGLLSWDCSTASSGVYFLSFSINGIKRVSPVMIVK